MGKQTRADTKMLIAGLGGGLDVVNATALWWMARAQGIDATLGSVKTRSIDHIVQGVRINDNAAWITPGSSFADLGEKSRYCEEALATYLHNDILYFGQKNGYGDKEIFDPNRLHASFEDVMTQYKFSHAVFLDCGGDCLTFVPHDATQYSETKDPFAGGDARTLEALSGVPNTYVAAAAVGLDVDRDGALANIRYLSIRNQYQGMLDLRTGDFSEYRFPIDYNPRGIEAYLRTVEQIVRLSPADEVDRMKFKSLTAPVLYHAVNGDCGRQYSAAKWGQGDNGTVAVLPYYSQVHFFAADKLHEIKLELNRKELGIKELGIQSEKNRE